MTKVRSALAGKKSYLTAAAAVLSGIVAFANGASPVEAVQLVLTGFGIGGLRSAIGKLA